MKMGKKTKEEKKKKKKKNFSNEPFLVSLPNLPCFEGFTNLPFSQLTFAVSR